MNNPYPNSFYVEKFIDEDIGWFPMMTSVSTHRTYSQGFLEACDGFQPHKGYRLIGKNGEVIEERAKRGTTQPFGRSSY